MNHPMLNGLYHPLMVILGMVYERFFTSVWVGRDGFNLEKWWFVQGSQRLGLKGWGFAGAMISKLVSTTVVKADIGQTHHVTYITGWWFGTSILFSHKYWVAFIIPIDFHIFQRGGPTTNQIKSWQVSIELILIEGLRWFGCAMADGWWFIALSVEAQKKCRTDQVVEQIWCFLPWHVPTSPYITPGKRIEYLVAHHTNRKWVITPLISGISRLNPLTIGVKTHLVSGMNHQVSMKVTLWLCSSISHCQSPRCSRNHVWPAGAAVFPGTCLVTGGGFGGREDVKWPDGWYGYQVRTSCHTTWLADGPAVDSCWVYGGYKMMERNSKWV